MALDDRAPIFLSGRRRQLGYSGFGAIFKRVLGRAQRHFDSAHTETDALRITLPSITPHTIRHLHTTFRVKRVRELFSTPAERDGALEALMDDLGWRSAETLKTYDHAITKAELQELMASSVRQVLDIKDPFARLKRRAAERAERAGRTVERILEGIATLRATGRSITAESLKQVPCDLEPGFTVLSFQVIRRNARAYDLYREAADAFVKRLDGDKANGRRRRASGRRSRSLRASYDPLQGLDKRKLVQRVRD